MPFIDNIPKNRLDPLAYLGRNDWLRPTPNGFAADKSRLQEILERSRQYGMGFAHQVREIINLSVSPEIGRVQGYLPASAYAEMFYIPSMVLAQGRKTIRLTPGWCEAFEETALSLRFADFKPPYPTMVVELPGEYAKSRFVPGADEYPDSVAVHHAEDAGLILVETFFQDSQATGIYPFEPGDVLEEKLGQILAVPLDPSGYADDPSFGRRLVNCIRIALNAIVAVTYGTDWRDVTPSQRRLTGELKGRSRGKSDSARLAQLQLKTMPSVFEFDQTIAAFRTQPAVDGTAEVGASGSSKNPHWRRGHWRNQAFGPDLGERRACWIRPCLVNSDRFLGDVKDTTTTYQARERNDLPGSSS